uniref:hypothetical protein n=1 Tax=Anabaena sp. CCY 9910 TaxID=3103870 RepID=UPI0039E0CF5E
LIQLETRYAAKGSITAAERNDLDTRLDALDVRVGDGPAVQPPVATQTPRVRLAALETAVTAAERSGALTRADAADVRVQLGDL